MSAPAEQLAMVLIRTSADPGGDAGQDLGGLMPAGGSAQRWSEIEQGNAG